MNTGEITPNLRMLCPTRWTVRHASIGSILRNYSILQNALDEIKLAMMNMQLHWEASQLEWTLIRSRSKLSYLLFSVIEFVNLILSGHHN